MATFKRMQQVLLLSLIILFNINPLHASSAKPFRVVTTFTILQDIAQNVAGDLAIVESIIKPGFDVHYYQPTPKDIVKIQGAQLILYNGLNLEAWLERFFKTSPDIPFVILTEGIQPLPIRENSERANPHAWMSPKNGLIYIDNIRDAFIKYDPKNAEIYRQNAKNYAEKLRQLDQKMTDLLAERFKHLSENQKWLVTTEGAFSYMAKAYHFKEAYLWPINSENQASSAQIKTLIELIKGNNIPVIFSESTVSDKPAKQVAKESGAQYGGILYVDSLSEKTGKVPTYLDLIEVNLLTIIQAIDLSIKK